MPRPSPAEQELRVGVDLVAVDRMARLLTDNPAAYDTLLTRREQSDPDLTKAVTR